MVRSKKEQKNFKTGSGASKQAVKYGNKGLDIKVDAKIKSKLR